MAPPYRNPKLSEKILARVEQGFFDFLVPYRGALLTPLQCARSLNRGMDFIYTLIADGKLETFGVPGREKERYQITKRSLLVYLAESANFEPGEYETRIEALLKTMDTAQLTRLIQRATAERACR